VLGASVEPIICGITSHSTYDPVSTLASSDSTMVSMEKNSNSIMNVTSSSSFENKTTRIQKFYLMSKFEQF
jgi:hypothetical protein